MEQARSLIPDGETAVRRELDQITAALETLPAGRERCGLIHGDFELDNLRWPGGVDGGPDGGDSAAHGNGAAAALGGPGMLDFDDCATHWYAADVAFALRDVFDIVGDLDDASVETFVRGYRAHRPLDDELVAALPLFSRLSRLLGYTTSIRWASARRYARIGS